MNICEIINAVDDIKDKDSLFLIDALSECAGFFAYGGQLLYIAKDIFGYSVEGTETAYLRLETHVYISSVENDPTYENDDYNIITYKGEFADEKLDSFIKLCRVHACNMEEIKFREFFYSLISLFQLPSEQSYKNAIGLYGELKFMQMAVDVYGYDISKSWHKKGTTSQYDFSNGKNSIEVKTTTTEQMSVMIKHRQIFTGHPCWLVVATCENYENGETIEELVDKLLDKDNAFRSMSFNINLAKELKKVSPREVKELRLKLHEIQVFDTDEINPFPSVPNEVDKLEYRLDVSEMEKISQDEIIKLVYEF